MIRSVLVTRPDTGTWPHLRLLHAADIRVLRDHSCDNVIEHAKGCFSQFKEVSTDDASGR